MKGRWFLLLPIIIWGFYNLYIYNVKTFHAISIITYILSFIITMAHFSYNNLTNQYLSLNYYETFREDEVRILRKCLSSNTTLDYIKHKREAGLHVFSSIKLLLYYPSLIIKFAILPFAVITFLYESLVKLLEFLDKHLSIFTDER